MAQNVTLYNLLVSCPGDVKAEVALIESAVDEFNELYDLVRSGQIKSIRIGRNIRIPKSEVIRFLNNT